MGHRRCWTVEVTQVTQAGSSGFPGSGVGWLLKQQMGSIQRCFLFARVVFEARWPIEDRIESHLGQCLAVKRGWSEEDMARTGIWAHHEVVGLGSDEEEMPPWP